MKTQQNFDHLAAAIEMSSRGWRIFPLHHPIFDRDGSCRCSCGDAKCIEKNGQGKHPRTPNGLNDADDDRDMITQWWRRWPTAGIGLATGQVSGVYVLDVDPEKGGENSLLDLVEAYGDLPITKLVDTGGGGQHWYFRMPTRTLRNTAGKLGPGLDTRGDGGYVVAPPSLHRSGARYEWRNDEELAEMPKWMLALIADPPPRVSSTAPEQRSTAENATYWLGRALGLTANGKRNEIGFWLACQLRDAGVSASEAEKVLCDYADRVPRGDASYTQQEAISSARSAYRAAARSPAKADRSSLPTYQPQRATPMPSGASAELGKYLGAVVSGEIKIACWPWPLLTYYTQALIPGTTTVFVGDPGVGKTYFLLQCLLWWQSRGIDAAAFLIEKNRRFHTMRLLAQLEGAAKFLDYEWIAKNGLEVEQALARHRSALDSIGKHIYSSDGKRVALGDILAWIRQMASMGRRIIAIDPITAVFAGADRWTKDDEFVLAAEHCASQHGASLIYISHSKKGNRPGEPTGHDTAGGAAYFRFCDTLLWGHKPKRPKEVTCIAAGNITHKITPSLFFQMHKTRNGKGAGHEIAYNFGDGLKFSEQGIVEHDA